MSTSYQGAAGPSGYAGLRPVPTQPLSQERSTSNQIRKLTSSVEAFPEQHKESFVTKETVATLLERFDRLGLEESTRTGALITLERIEGRLRELSNHVENMGHVGSNEDTKVVSELMDCIRDAVISCQRLIPQPNMPGEPPPPRPRACFGRDELIEEIVGLAEDLIPMALIGPGGIGKTSIVLAVLHHDRVKERFGDDRRFIRCDQFPASPVHLLSRLSKAIGAGVENPEDLTPLRFSLSSREMIICLDNAESILDPRGTNAREIYAVVEELSQFSNICLCITSRISTIPPTCESFDVPTLSTTAAYDTFHRIYKYKNNGQSDPVNGILKQLDFHPLSITLLATVVYHNKWDVNRLSKEWEKRRTAMLHTQHNDSLAATVELSLASPMFQELGPDARGLLGVIAFFPQGVDENNLEWLFPTLSNITGIFDNFCVLSLTYRNGEFVTMLAPLRDYLCPKHPALSPLLHTTKDSYFRRLLVDVIPDEPGFEEAQWVRLEDVNIEHLLDVFMSTDTDSIVAWDVCAYFMNHLHWHKKRLIILGPKIERLPGDHRSKPECLFGLSQLFNSVGNHMESKRLLTHALKLWREREDDLRVADMLRFISEANKLLCLNKEGIEQATEALEIYERFGHTSGQALSLRQLAWLLFQDNQLDAAEEAALKVINISDKNNQSTVCSCYGLLGDICHSRGETEKAIDHHETALGIASSSNWFSDAHVHIERAKLHTLDNPYQLGRAMELQAGFWYKERRFEEAKSEALRATDVYEGIGAAKDVVDCETLLRKIEAAKTETLAASSELDFDAQGSRHHPTSFQTEPPANR